MEATGKQLTKPWKLETLPVKTLERKVSRSSTVPYECPHVPPRALHARAHCSPLHALAHPSHLSPPSQTALHAPSPARMPVQVKAQDGSSPNGGGGALSPEDEASLPAFPYAGFKLGVSFNYNKL